MQEAEEEEEGPKIPEPVEEQKSEFYSNVPTEHKFFQE